MGHVGLLESPWSPSRSQILDRVHSYSDNCSRARGGASDRKEAHQGERRREWIGSDTGLVGGSGQFWRSLRSVANFRRRCMGHGGLLGVTP